MSDVARLMREVYTAGGLKILVDHSGSALDEWLSHHIEFVVSVLGLTQRPTLKWLRGAVQDVFDDTSLSQSTAFASMVLSAITSARVANTSITTGEKLSAPMRRLVHALTPESCAPVAQSSTRRLTSKQPRHLSREHSNVSVMSIDSKVSVASSQPGVIGSALSTADPNSIVNAYLSGSALSTRASALHTSSALSSVASVANAHTVVDETRVVKFEAMNGSRRVMVRHFDDGAKVGARMEPGDAGFAIAHFDDKIVETEMPNVVMLQVPIVVKRKPAALLKRPAACVPDPCDEDSAADGDVMKAKLNIMM